MRAIGQFLVLATISVLFSACGGGGDSKSQQVQIPDPPAAPVVTVGPDIKQLIFNWDAVATATHYQLLENPDGHSGFTKVGDNIPSTETSVARDIAVHMHDWVNALYLVRACNSGGCTDSTQVSATDLMLDTIGYFKASNTDPKDYFGGSVALSADGNTLAVGAPWEKSNATGINGDQADNSAESAGAVYLFRLDGAGWHQEAYVKASNTDRRDEFGTSISLSSDGNTLAVGAPNESSGAIGVNGDQEDNSAAYAGAVYMFRFDGTTWLQQSYLKASNAREGHLFGTDVALSGDGHALAVGTPNEPSSAVGVNGNETDISAGGAGAVYLFRFDGTDWYQQAYVKASNTDPHDRFGSSIDLSADGHTLAVCAINEDSIATGINGDQADNSAAGAGAAYLMRFDNQAWSQQAYVKASNTEEGDSFCDSIALDANGDTLVVGAPREDSRAIGIDGDEFDDGPSMGGDSGAVYVYRFNGADWFQQAYVKASNSSSGEWVGGCEPNQPEYCYSFGDMFGTSIALSADGNTLSVGAFQESSNAAGVDGDQADDSIFYAGAAYVFQFSGENWIQQAYVKASNTDGGENFGASMAISADGHVLAVGAAKPYRGAEWSSATGINGDQSDNSAEYSGAVYIY